MIFLQTAALQLFVNRLRSRSILTEKEVSAIMALEGQVEQVRTHTEVVRQGEQVSHCALVLKGLIGRFGENAEGARQITCLHIPGDFADLPSVMVPKCGWGLAALTETIILRVPHIDVRRIAATHSGIVEALWRDCVADGSIFSEWVINVGRRSALARLAHLICEMAVRCERAGQGDRRSFPLPVTQADLGEATGLTSVHVNRTLKALRDRSVATVRGGTVTIQDWDQLVSVGEFDDAFMLLDGPAPRLSVVV